jgi:hypothetical protein
MDVLGFKDGSRRAMLLVALVALVLRLAFVIARDRPLVSDEVDYHRLATTLASTGHYSEDGVPTAYRPVGYPAIVAAVYSIAGPRPEAVHVLQAVVDAGSAVLLIAIAGGGVVGLLAGLFWALFPAAILYTDLLMPETVFTVCLLGAVLLTRRGFPASGGRALAIGLLIGAATLIRPVALLLLAAVPLAAHVTRVTIPRPVPILAGMLLLVAPWLARNAIVLHYPGLVTSTGTNLLIGKHPHATGGYSPNVPAPMIPPPGPEAKRDLASITSALGYIGREPGSSATLGFAGLAHLFGSETGMTVWVFHRDPMDSSTRLRDKIRSLPWWVHVPVSGATMALLLLGTIGFARVPIGPTRGWFLALLVALVATHFVFYGGARYHFPLMPFFVLFTAALVAGLPGSIRPHGRAATVSIAATWAGLLGIWAGEAAILFRG